MRIKKYVALLSTMLILFAFIMTGCEGSMNTIQTCVISHEQYSNKTELESAKQPDRFEAGKDIYANVYFIESPLGMEYTARWTMKGSEIKMEKKEMKTDKQGLIIFTLEAENVDTGTLVFEVLYGNNKLLSKELSVQ
jgi:hypothetical protein